MKRNTLFIILLSLVIVSCEESIQKEINGENSDLLVVEAVLTNENINHRVRLTHPHQSQNATPTPATGATVVISDENNFFPLVEFPAGSGEYYTQPMRAVFGRTYTLRIRYRGNDYIAVDSPAAGEPMPPLNVVSASDDEPLFEIRFDDSGSEPNYIDHFVLWQHTAYCAATGADCFGKVTYYDLKTIDVNEIYKPGKAEFLFPETSIIIRRKYSVSAGYREFLRSLLSETEWRGGVFDVDRSNIPTNLSAGAVGYFAVSTVVTDSTVFVNTP